jgi:hypothetical protein
MGLKRHPYLNHEIFGVVFAMAQGAIRDFFEIQMRRTINNDQELIRTILLLLEPLLSNKEAKREVLEGGCFELWERNFDLAISAKLKGKEIILINEETKILQTELLYTLFMSFYREI